MKIGSQIRKYRKQQGMTQSQLAELLDVSFQAVSCWENDEYLPDLTRLTEIARNLNVSVSKLLEEKADAGYPLRDRLSDETRMYTMLKTTLRTGAYPLAYRAIGYLGDACASDLSPARRAMLAACHALALNISSDEMLELLLYHGLRKSLSIPLEKMPASSGCLASLRLIEANRDTPAENPVACMVRCFDFVYALSTLTLDGQDQGADAMIKRAEEEIIPLLKDLKNTVPEWHNAVFLLRYQILALLETYKRLL